jgi:hypothetical protein
MTVNKVADFEEMFQISENGSDYHLDQMADDDTEDEGVEFVLEEADMAQLIPNSPISVIDLSDNEEIREKDWENDGDHGKFIDWFRGQLSGLPQHSGQTTVGIERVIAAIDRLNRDLSKAVQSDLDGAIDEAEAEQMRDTLYEWKDTLEEAKSKLLDQKQRKKKSTLRIGKEVVARFNDGEDIQYFISVTSGDDETLLKVDLVEPTNDQVASFLENETFTKAAGAGITLVEDPFLHSITRLLIQSHITNGRDMEVIYATLREKYSFTPREELSIHELLHQKGFPLAKDLGRLGEETVRPGEGRGVEHDTEYYA